MTFSTALNFLKLGARVGRAGWNGKGMWIAISPGVKDNPTEKFWSKAVRIFGTENSVKTITGIVQSAQRHWDNNTTVTLSNDPSLGAAFGAQGVGVVYVNSVGGTQAYNASALVSR